MPMVRLENPEQHDISGWAARATELNFECERLRAALREALDEWEGWLDDDRGDTDPRITELRKQFLED